MPITAPAGTTRELIPAGNYVAICYSMLQLGTQRETFKGVEKQVPKVRIGWELCDELKVFKEGDPAKPLVIEKEYTLFMNDKATLRKELQSWRGAAWTDKEAADFDITKLIGAPCMLNIIHKPSADGTKTYENIAGITPLPKGMPKPTPFNKTRILAFDSWDEELFNSLPAFITDKVKASPEYNALKHPEQFNFIDDKGQPVTEDDDDGQLPF